MTDLRAKVFNHIVRLPARFFDCNHSGEIASRLTADATQIKAAVSLSASVALRNAILCAGALGMMFVTSPRLSTIAVGVIPLIIAPLIYFGRSVRKKSRAAQDAGDGRRPDRGARHAFCAFARRGTTSVWLNCSSRHRTVQSMIRTPHRTVAKAVGRKRDALRGGRRRSTRCQANSNLLPGTRPSSSR
ncbi:ABC-type multidrug transport system fused ATPase/permease subunit [Rhizobium sp. BK060]|nr:ABC-type multidrug transport system fused ATPase/permease subunit [Rhizobium sp. BK060]